MKPIRGSLSFAFAAPGVSDSAPLFVRQVGLRSDGNNRPSAPYIYWISRGPFRPLLACLVFSFRFSSEDLENWKRRGKHIICTTYLFSWLSETITRTSFALLLAKGEEQQSLCDFYSQISFVSMRRLWWDQDPICAAKPIHSITDILMDLVPFGMQVKQNEGVRFRIVMEQPIDVSVSVSSEWSLCW